MTTEEAARLIATAFMAQVESRGREVRLDEATMESIGNVAKALTAQEPKMGLMLCGLCGNGKTTMAYALQRAVNYLKDQGMFGTFEKRHNVRVGMQITDVDEIVMLSTMTQKNEAWAEWSNLKQRYMLCIEDLGKEPKVVQNYGNLLQPMVELIEARYANNLFTLITTNLKPSEIIERYGPRVADRMKEMVEVVVFGGQSYR